MKNSFPFTQCKPRGTLPLGLHVVTRLLAQGLDGDGLLHDGIEILHGHGAQHSINLLLEHGVALHHGNANVHVLCPHFLIELEVAIGAGEVQNLQVGIGGNGNKD